MSLRSKLFLLASFALCGAALLVGMLGEWVGPEPSGPVGPVAILALATFGASLALGVAFAKRMQAGRRDAGGGQVSVGAKPVNDGHGEVHGDGDGVGDGRPVLVFIWWPIVIISIGVAILMATIAALQGVTTGSGLPVGICLLVGVFGFICLPNIVGETRAEFRGRGFRKFWRAFRATPWGDGGIN